MPLLRVCGLSKAFTAPVLRCINFSLDAGEVVALTGENGAGKSTFSKVVAGLVRADSGTMTLNDIPFAPRTRTEAELCGVRIVLQELSLIGTLSVAENLQLGKMPSRGGFIKFGELERIARDQLQRVGLSHANTSQHAGGLGIGQQQLIEIARGLSGDVKLLILDEPTAMLTESETGRLFEVIAALRAKGIGVLYISHRLDELKRVSDRIVVLRDGQLIADQPAANFARADIVRAMIGHDRDCGIDRERGRPGVPLLRVRGVSGNNVRDVTLQANSGEILGIAGLVGSGRTELLRLIFGVTPKSAGEVLIGDTGCAARIDSPHQAVVHGMGMLPEDRKGQGLLMTQSLAMNVTLADMSLVARYGLIDRAKEQAFAQKWLRRLGIRARNADQVVADLSGGNQQKALLARWLHRNCTILLLDEPTRGVDVGARADIYSELDALARAGKALLVVSSDLEELMLIADRIAVMSAGRLVRTFERGEWNEQALLSAAFADHVIGAHEKVQGIA